MNLKFDKSFLKSIEKIKDASLKQKIENVIGEVESAKDLNDVKQLKKLKGYKSYYRIKMGDYRVGIELEQPGVVTFIVMAHRKEIYRRFP
ncbi:MAG TPA: type II toxin-antitoxin system RelE/ParE family toxin [Parapedobacter sp.]|uniref:type II toxin-antitoxin system RelE family toxin n=1 Tax=Parapedobacter sp. TaxID=1958893 RepID=UPI002BEDAA37|nr:type II toxin-antitoxin system RelE/ParE family toxin [Parapedobacter sp.]HWK56529.1 type II toxin-antitoxin system RelE/ParE family toxin [Parapedobacter sp.]